MVKDIMKYYAVLAQLNTTNPSINEILSDLKDGSKTNYD